MLWPRKVKFTLVYWNDNKFYVGRLKEVPGVFSQGATLQELRENIEDAYHLMMEDEDHSYIPVQNFETEQLRIAM